MIDGIHLVSEKSIEKVDKNANWVRCRWKSSGTPQTGSYEMPHRSSNKWGQGKLEWGKPAIAEDFDLDVYSDKDINERLW